MRHKHYNEIIAWAEGKEIESRRIGETTWGDNDHPSWLLTWEYRVKDPYAELEAAYKANKIIQVNTRTISDPNWVNMVNKPKWAKSIEYYRVKPKPEYIPFEWEDRGLLGGKWFVERETGREYLITSLIRSAGGFLLINHLNAAVLVHDFTFLDGSPFGKIK